MREELSSVVITREVNVKDRILDWLQIAIQRAAHIAFEIADKISAIKHKRRVEEKDGYQ